METKTSKVFFVEYSTWNKGQHFITAMLKINGKKYVIGRIFREYDAENKKIKYYAKDRDGNQVFADTQNLTNLKKKFVEHGKSFGYAIPNIGTVEKEIVEPRPEKSAREKELQQMRDKQDNNKEQEKGIGR